MEVGDAGGGGDEVRWVRLNPVAYQEERRRQIK